MGSTVDPAKSIPKSFLNVESLKSSLESLDNTISFSQEQLALMYSAFNKFNKMTEFAYDSSHFYSFYSDFVCDINDTLREYIATLEIIGEHDPIIEQTKTINIGSEENPKPLSIGTSLTEAETLAITNLLTEFGDVLAWSYKDMPGIDRSIAEHKIPIKPGFRPVKQKLRGIRPEWSIMVKEEDEKQLQAGFIEVSQYSDWYPTWYPYSRKMVKSGYVSTFGI